MPSPLGTLLWLGALFVCLGSFSGCAHQGARATALSPHQQEVVASHLLIAAAPGATASDALALEMDFIDEKEEASLRIPDPLAPLNRLMFHFNDRLYFWILKPVAQTYRAVIPAPLRVGIQNFYNNLGAPIRIVNALLQGKGRLGADEFTRFVVNTGPGLLGILNAAQNIPDLQAADEDLGQTLAVCGFGDGFYIVWPFLGPSTLRDSIGSLGDGFLNPLNYVQPIEAALGMRIWRTVNDVSFRIGDYEALKDAALEPYAAFQNAYIQHRQKKIKD